MRTLIHIGQHKTGTTSIQHYLQKYRPALAKAGLYVPDTLLGFTNPSHFLLNVYALDADRDSTAKIMLRESVDPGFYDTLESRLQQDIARHYERARDQGCRDIIWSNEGLYLLNSTTEYQRLKGLFAKYSEQLTCLCCLRDKASYLDSYRRQLHSLNLPLSDDPRSTRYLEPDSWLVDYEGKQKLLNAVFEDTLILEYNPQDMVKTFLDAIGYEPVGDTGALRLNTTSSKDS